MNDEIKVNVTKVLDHIKNEGNHFNMRNWDYFSDEFSCGTPSCIGGWAESIMKVSGIEGDLDEESYSVSYIGNWLGFTIDQSDKAFFPENNEIDIPERKSIELLTRQDAINMLENYIETGEVEWK